MSNSPDRRALCVIATPLAASADLDRLVRSSASLCATVADPDVLIVLRGAVDDRQLDQVAALAAELELGVDFAGPHASTAEALNRGMALARDGGADCVLIDPGSEFRSAAWLPVLQARAAAGEQPIGVVGARMVKSNGTIHRAGYMFSRLTREWHARLEWAPAEMAEGLRAYRCPVGGGVELVRHEALVAVGLLDARMPPPLDSIDYCLRAHRAGYDCVMEPSASVGWEGVAPGWPDREASAPFNREWAGSDLSAWVPPIS